MQSFASAILLKRLASSRKNLQSHRKKEDDDISIENFDEAVAKGEEDLTHLKHFWGGIKRVIKANQPRDLSEKYYDIQGYLTEKKNSSSHRWVIRPDNKWKIMWDLLLFVLTVYSVAVAFYIIGMNVPTEAALDDFNNFVTAMFAVDLFLSFTTAYLDEESGLYITNRNMIAKQYFKFWFWVDFLATVPFDAIIQDFIEAKEYLVAIRMIRFLRIMRVVKLYKLLADDGWISKLKINPQLLQLLILLGQLAFIIHLFACFWHFIAIPDNSETFFMTWIEKFGFSGAQTSNRYLASLYFIMVSMLTVGYGDIYATNQVERGYAMLTMLVGVIFFSSLMSKVANFIDKMNPQAKMQDERMEELKLFLNGLTLPRHAKTKITVAYQHYFTHKTSVDDISEEVAKPLLIELIFDLHERDINKFYLFRKLRSREFVYDIVAAWKPFHANPGDILYEKGDLIDDIIMVKNGRIRLATILKSVPVPGLSKDFSISSISSTNSSPRKISMKRRQSTRSSLNVFGKAVQNRIYVVGGISEGKYFGDLENLKSSPALVQYTAISYCTMFAISFDNFNKAISEEENMATHFKNYCQARYFTLKQSLKNSIDSYIDLKPAKVSLNSYYNANHTFYDAYSNEYLWIDGRRHFYQGLIKHFVTYPKNVVPHGVKKQASVVPTAVPTSENQEEEKEEEDEAFNEVEPIRCIVNTSELSTLPLDPNSIPPTRKPGSGPSPKYVVADVLPEGLTQRWLLLPTGPRKICWDLIVGLCILISVLIVPMQIAFSHNVFDGVDILNDIIYVVFGIDIILTFRTVIESKEHQAYIINWKTIAKKYLASWFWIDLISTIPFNDVISPFIQADTSSLIFIQLIKLLRLVSLVRLMKIIKSFDKYESLLNIPPIIMKLLGLFGKVFLVTHWMGCLWWGITSIASKDPWYTDTGPEGLVYGRLTDVHVSAQYLVSIYYTFITMTTVGYGDIHPTNPPERLIGLFFVLVCILIFSYMIANLTSAINGMASGNGEIADTVSSVHEYLKEKDCSVTVRDRILFYYEKKLKNKISYDVVNITDRLPDPLKNMIYLAFYQKQLKKVLFLQFIPNNTIKIKLFSLLKPIYYESNSYVLKEDDVKQKDLLFLMTGAAKIFKKLPSSTTVDDKSATKEQPMNEKSPFSAPTSMKEGGNVTSPYLARRRANIADGAQPIRPSINLAAKLNEQNDSKNLESQNVSQAPKLSLANVLKKASMKDSEKNTIDLPLKTIEENGNGNGNSNNGNLSSSQKVSTKMSFANAIKKVSIKESSSNDDANSLLNPSEKISIKLPDGSNKVGDANNTTAATAKNVTGNSKLLNQMKFVKKAVEVTKTMSRSGSFFHENQEDRFLTDDDLDGKFNERKKRKDGNIIDSDDEDGIGSTLPFFSSMFHKKEEFPSATFPNFTYGDFQNYGYLFLGDLIPGEFIGYNTFLDHITTYSTAFSKASTKINPNNLAQLNTYSIRTCQDSFFLILERDDLVDLIRKSPYIAFELQMALAKSITIQMENVSSNYLNHLNSYFLKELHSHAPPPEDDEENGGVSEGETKNTTNLSNSKEESKSNSIPMSKENSKKTTMKKNADTLQNRLSKRFTLIFDPKTKRYSRSLKKKHQKFWQYYNCCSSRPATSGKYHSLSREKSLPSFKKFFQEFVTNSPLLPRTTTTTSSSSNNEKGSKGRRTRSYSFNDLDYHKSVNYNMNIALDKPKKKDRADDEEEDDDNERHEKNAIHPEPSAFMKKVKEEENDDNHSRDSDDMNDEEESDHEGFIFTRTKRSHSFPFYEFDKWERHVVADHNVLVI